MSSVASPICSAGCRSRPMSTCSCAMRDDFAASCRDARGLRADLSDLTPAHHRPAGPSGAPLSNPPPSAATASRTTSWSRRSWPRSRASAAPCPARLRPRTAVGETRSRDRPAHPSGLPRHRRRRRRARAPRRGDGGPHRRRADPHRQRAVPQPRHRRGHPSGPRVG